MNKTVYELVHAGFISEKQFDLAQQAIKSRIENPSVLPQKLGCLFKTPSKWDSREPQKGIETFPDVLFSGKHPESFSLADKIAPVMDQKDRSASPAAAVTALLRDAGETVGEAEK